MANSDIITPWLPENLESLHKHEEEIRTKSVLEINSDKELKDQLVITQESLSYSSKNYYTVINMGC